MWKAFLLFELRSWLRGFMVWIFFLVIALLIFAAASTDSLQVGGSLGNLHRNAPYVVQRWYGIMSIIGLLMTTAIVNASATRDFASNAHQIVFTTSVRRFDYLFGRFAGSALAAMIPPLGITLGIVLAQFMPWVDAERWGPIYWSAHAQSILAFVIPNTIFVSAIVFSIAILTRSTVQSFLGSILLLVAWGVSNSLIDNLDNERLSMLLDPFGLEAFATMTKYWTPAERNRQSLGLEGMLLLNRLVWLPVGLAILGLACMRFRFEERAAGGSWWARWRRNREARSAGAPAARVFDGRPAAAPGLAGLFRQWWGFTRTEFFGLVRSTAFVVIVVAALLNTIPGLYLNAEAGYGNQSFPVTYRIVEMIQGSMYVFLLAIITYYAGVLVWRERDARFDEIHDALPYPAWMPLAAKLAALLLTLLLMQVLATGIGMAVQASKGYTRFQPGIYAMEFFASGMTLFYFFAALAFLIHVVTPNKYFGYFAFVIFLVASGPMWIPLDVVTKMVNFAERPSMVYSDLYGYAPFLPAWLWFTGYWLLFCTLLLVLAAAWWPRGRDASLRQRVSGARLRAG
ncbi:MAG: ABC transporter permease, partial [Bryobacterales bacterium]|nr:ABC transporter permease [Bryobacterales bacterium]